MNEPLTVEPLTVEAYNAVVDRLRRERSHREQLERENAILRDALLQIIGKRVAVQTVMSAFEELFLTPSPKKIAFDVLARVDNPEACP